MPYVRACLERSKSVGLSIRISFGAKCTWDCNLSFLAEVTPHSSRWEQLDVDFNLAKLGIDHREKFLQSNVFSNLYLPSLHSLSLQYVTWHPRGPSLDIDDTLHFYQSWMMPNLRSLDTGSIPKSIIAPNLSYLSLSADKGDRLRDFITAFPALQELNIVISCDVRLGFGHTFAIDMPNLTALRITTHKDSGIRSFMSALRAPALRKLKISMPAPEDENDCYSALNDFFPHDDYPALEDLSLEIQVDTSTIIHVPFERLRGLRSLSLDTSSLASYIPFMDTDYEDRFIPPLRKIKVTNCDDTYLDWLQDVRDCLIENKFWPGFQELEISSALSSSSVRKINTLYGEENKTVSWKEE